MKIKTPATDYKNNNLIKKKVKRMLETNQEKIYNAKDMCLKSVY